MVSKNPLNSNTNSNVLQQIEDENDLSEIKIDRGIEAYFAILISLSVTLFGMYGFLASATQNQNIIYGSLIIFGSLILFIEKQRTHLLVDFYSSKLEEYIQATKKPFFGLVMAIIFSSVFVALDVFGATSLSIYVKSMLVENSVVESESYRIATKNSDTVNQQNNISQGAYTMKLETYKSDMTDYPKAIKSWEKSIKNSNTDCNTQFPSGWISKRDNCKKRFLKANPKPKKPIAPNAPKLKTSKLANDFKELEDSAKKEYNDYDQYLFYAFLFLSLILNYLAVSSVFNQYRRKSKELDDDEMSAILKSRFAMIKGLKNKKMENSSTAINEKLEESYMIDVEIEKSTYDLNLNNKKNVLENRKNIVNNIGYTQQFPTKKAGKLNLVNTTSSKDVVTTTLNLDDFTSLERDIVGFLFEGVGSGKQLNKRDLVLEKIGKSKSNANMIRDVYAKLVEQKLIKIGRYKAYYLI